MSVVVGGPVSIDRLARVLILLPPSETKAPPATGEPLQLDLLDLPELTPTRERLLRALVMVCVVTGAAR